MRYFIVKQVVTEYTTLSIVLEAGDTAILYHQDGTYGYWGVQTEDENFLTKQHPECEAEEISFADIQNILRDCRMMKDYDAMIEKKIAEKYSIGRELKMRDLAPDSLERIEYEEYKEAVKAPIRLLKKAAGLIE